MHESINKIFEALQSGVRKFRDYFFSKIARLKSEGFDIKIDLKYLASLWKLVTTGNLGTGLRFPVKPSSWAGFKPAIFWI